VSRGRSAGASVRETSSPTVPSGGGGDGEWELRTSWPGGGSREAGAMTPRGYTVRVTAVDTTIVNDSYGGHRSSDLAGLCLLPEGTEVTDSDADWNGTEQ